MSALRMPTPQVRGGIDDDACVPPSSLLLHRPYCIAATTAKPEWWSSGDLRCPAREHGCHPGPIDVLAAHDDAHAPSRELRALLDQRCERGGAGALGASVGGAVEHADRLGHLVVGNLDEALGATAD